MRKLLLAAFAFALPLLSGCDLIGDITGSGSVKGRCDHRSSATNPKPSCIEYEDDLSLDVPEITCNNEGGTFELDATCPTEGVVGTCKGTRAGSDSVNRWYDGLEYDIQGDCGKTSGTYEAGDTPEKLPTALVDGSGWKQIAIVRPPVEAGVFNPVDMGVLAVAPSPGGLLIAYRAGESSQQSILNQEFKVEVGATVGTPVSVNYQGMTSDNPAPGRSFLHKGAIWHHDQGRQSGAFAVTTLLVQADGATRASHEENTFHGDHVYVAPDDTIYWYGMSGMDTNRVSPVIQPFAHVFDNGTRTLKQSNVAFDSTTTVRELRLTVLGGTPYMFWLQTDNKLVAYKHDGSEWTKAAEQSVPVTTESTLELAGDTWLVVGTGTRVQTFSFASDAFSTGASLDISTPNARPGVVADGDTLYLAYGDADHESKTTVMKLANGTATPVGIPGFTRLAVTPRLAIVGGVPTIASAFKVTSPVTGVERRYIYVHQPE